MAGIPRTLHSLPVSPRIHHHEDVRTDGLRADGAFVRIAEHNSRAAASDETILKNSAHTSHRGFNGTNFSCHSSDDMVGAGCDQTGPSDGYGPLAAVLTSILWTVLQDTAKAPIRANDMLVNISTHAGAHLPDR